MASKAFEEAKRKMDAETEARIAELIMRDVNQLTEKAQDLGVTAYRLKPVHRERLNERFLQGTLRSVKFANRRAEEEDMWERRAQQLRRSQGRGELRQTAVQQQSRSQSRVETPNMRQYTGEAREPCSYDPRRPAAESDVSNSSVSVSEPADRTRSEDITSSDDAQGMQDEDLNRMLASRQVRGRGAVGPRAGEPGPFLPATVEQLCEYDAERRPGQVQGPQRPPWLTKHIENSADATYTRMYEAELEQILASAATARKAVKKQKKDKKGKKRREKERKQKKRKKGKSRGSS